MKKFYVTIMLSFMAAVVFAVPALRGQWKVITLTDGTQVKAQLVGDEHGHFWVDENGRAFMPAGQKGLYKTADKSALQRQAQQKRAKANARRTQRRVPIGVPHEPIVGNKKALVILVQFKGENFTYSKPQALYRDMLNKKGYNGTSDYVNAIASFNETTYMTQSVNDYFKKVSDNKLDIQFDVVGPIQLPKEMKYYGEDYYDDYGMILDYNIGEMVKYACENADETVNFADYDWDGDGEVDQVVVLYNGLGQAAGGDEDTVWPQEFWMNSTASTNYGKKPLVLDGVMIETFACTPELIGYNEQKNGQAYYVQVLSGLGTFCHEFSHCMGLPDMYDTGDQTNYGLYEYSIMDNGNYNGSPKGYTPAEYTAYERMFAGWRQPVELTDDMEVNGMKPIAKGGETYIFYNDGNPNEFFMLENRQHGWGLVETGKIKSYEQLYETVGYFDCGLYGDGLLITHVDFDQEMWENNLVNTTSDVGIGIINDHQRCHVVAADGSYMYSESNIDGDCFPYVNNVGKLVNSEFSDKSTKGAEWYNDNSQGDRKLHAAITDITQNDDLSISFKFTKEKVEDGIKDVQTAAADQQRSSKLYDLGGREMKGTQAVGKGIYIRGGKKFVVK